MSRNKQASCTPEDSNGKILPLRCRICKFWKPGENHRFGHCCYKPKQYELVNKSDPAHNYPDGRTTPAVYGCEHFSV